MNKEPSLFWAQQSFGFYYIFIHGSVFQIWIFAIGILISSANWQAKTHKSPKMKCSWGFFNTICSIFKICQLNRKFFHTSRKFSTPRRPLLKLLLILRWRNLRTQLLTVITVGRKTFESWWSVWAMGRTPEDDTSALVEEIKLINEIDFKIH